LKNIAFILVCFTLTGCATTHHDYARLTPVTWGAQEHLLGVRSVRPVSHAYAAGIQPGDLLVSLDRKPVYAADKFDRLLREGKGPIKLEMVRAGVPWDIEFPAILREEGLGWTLVPAYRSFAELEQPTVVTEGKSVAMSSWMNVSDDLTVVYVEMDNRLDESIEVIPSQFTLLNGQRRLIKPYYPKELAQTYLDNSYYQLNKAQLTGTSRNLRMNLNNLGTLQSLLTLALVTIPTYIASGHLKEAKHAKQMAESIIDRSYTFGNLPGYSTREGLFYYPRIQVFPVTLLVDINQETLMVSFTQSEVEEEDEEDIES